MAQTANAILLLLFGAAVAMVTVMIMMMMMMMMITVSMQVSNIIVLSIKQSYHISKNILPTSF
jgi:hypothetical protein